MLRIQKDKNIFFKLTMANTISTITLLVLLFLTPVILIFTNLSFHSAGGGHAPPPPSGSRGGGGTPVAPRINFNNVNCNLT